MKSILKVNLILTQVAFVVSLFSCSKSLTSEDSILQENRIGLKVDVAGVLEREEVNTFDQVKASALMSYMVEKNKPEITSFSDFDAVTSIEPLQVSNNKKKVKDHQLSAAEGSSSLISYIPLGVYYYLVLYENNNGSFGNYVTGVLMKAGESRTISVPSGKSYMWIAYSYNSKTNLGETQLPEISSSTAATTIVMGKNLDFLYAKGTTSVVSATEPTTLNIVMDHKMARIGVELNSMGMFADINTAEITLSGSKLYTANFNLLTGAKSGADALVTAAITKNDFVNVPSYSKKDRQVVYFYTSKPGTISNFEVKLNNFNINLDAEAVAAGFPTRDFVYTTNKPTFSTSTLNPTIGKSYIYKIDLIESSLAVSSTYTYSVLGIPVSLPKTVETKWARSNLYFHPSDNTYRFQHFNLPTNNRASYFSWGSLTPFLFGKDQDPCMRVYPYGAWRQPTASDVYALVGGDVTDVNLLGLIKINLGLTGGILGVKYQGVTPQSTVGNYVEYVATSGDSRFYDMGANTSINNNVRINYNGFGINLGLVENIINLDFGVTRNNKTMLWTSSKTADVLGIVGVSAIVLYADNIISPKPIASLLNIDALGLDVAETHFSNIRCVRN